jgi:hypothetical protein
MVSCVIRLIALLATATSIDCSKEEQLVASSSLLQSNKHLDKTSNEPRAVASSCLLQKKEVKSQLPPDVASDTIAVQEHAAGIAQTDSQMSADCTIEGVVAPHEAIHTLSFASDYNDHKTGLQGLFVDPDHNFAFCLIEKNACSTWIRTVLQPLLYKNASECTWSRPGAWCKDGQDYAVSAQSQKKHGAEAIEKIFRDPHATRAVFVRDPMERFASAFMNKCVGISESSKDLGQCPGNSKVFRDTFEWLLRVENMENLDGHFLPQAYHCQLHKRIKGYNIVSAISKETFTNDMNCVLAKAGLNSFIKDSPSPMVNRAMSFLEPGHKRSSSTDAISVMKKLFTKDAAKKFIAKYSVDYNLFGFSKTPAWMEEATGEWYDKEPNPTLFVQTESREKKMDKGQSNLDSFAKFSSSWIDEDIDDLGELAVRSGYPYH